MKTTVTILLCLSILFWVALAAYYTFRRLSGMGRYKRRTNGIITFVFCLFCSIFCLRYAVGLFGKYYPELVTIGFGSEAVGLNWFEEFVNSLLHTLQTFSMDEDYTDYIISGKTMVRELYGVEKPLELLYGIYDSLLDFIAPMAAGAVVLELLASIFPKIRLWFSNGREIFYFSELNEASLTLAKSIAASNAGSVIPPVIVFTDAYISDEEKVSELIAAAKSLGAICLKDDLSLVRMGKRGKKKFFLIDAVESENLKTLNAIMGRDIDYIKKSEIYLFVNSDAYVQIERSIRSSLTATGMDPDNIPIIIPVRCYRNLVTNLLCDIPLYEPLIGKPRNSDGTVDLTVTILGAGDIGKEMFLAVYWFGQILNCNLKINVVSNETKEEFWGKIDYVNPEIRHTTIKNDPILQINRKGDMAEIYCDVNYCQCDVKSSEFIESLSDVESYVLATDYFLVCLGSDEDNISAANALRRYVGQYHLSKAYASKKHEKKASNGADTVITYVVYDSVLSRTLNVEKCFKSDGKITDIYMRAVGSLEEVYSEKNITMSDYTLLASGISNAYGSVQKRSKTKSELSDSIKNRYKDDYKYWANLARAMHIKYKLFSVGVITESGLGENDSSKQPLDDMYNRFKEMVTSDDLKLLHEMAWLEHRRWNAFTRVKGFRHTGDYDSYAVSGQAGSYKQMEIGLHPCLVECDKKGIRATIKNGSVVGETLWQMADDPDLDFLDDLSYDLYNKGYNGYDFKEYDYPVNDLSSIK